MTFGFEKSRAPKALRDWIADDEQRQSIWDEFKGDFKQKVRTRLHCDQQGLCCYCYARIADDHTAHIEHIEAQSDENRYDWENLALTCEGGNTTHNPPHCDHSKGNLELKGIRPYRNPVHRHVRLGGKGQLKRRPDKNEPWWFGDIEDVLNLNATHLQRQRVAARDAALVDLQGSRRRRSEYWRPRDLNRVHDEIRARLDARQPADYDPLLLDWLERRMTSRS